MNTKFGLLTYPSNNLGDEIQSLAAKRLLPRVDFWVDREGLHLFDGDGHSEYRVILHGWFMQHPDRWPPSASLSPLLTSFHLTEVTGGPDSLGLVPTRVLLQGANLEYLRSVGPVGARDLHTQELLERHSVSTYFSGCLTLTFDERNPEEAEDVVCLVDVDDEIANACRSRTKSDIRLMTHIHTRILSQTDKFERAERLLSTYRRAKCVITSRLHVALPCLAMKVPVLLLNVQPDQYRFRGLHLLVRNSSRDEFLSNRVDFDVEYPTPNSDAYLRYRQLLTKTVMEFIERGRGPASENITVLQPTAWALVAELSDKLADMTRQRDAVAMERDALLAAPPANRIVAMISRSARRLGFGWPFWTRDDRRPDANSGGPASVGNRAEPILLEEGYHSFNIISCAGRFYALAQSLGPMDLMQIEREELERYEREGSCVIGKSLFDLKRRVASSCR